MEVRNFILWLLIAIILIFLLTLIIPIASAYPYIQQSGTINQTETYDMTSVYGWTGKFAHWDNSYDENTDVEPDQIVDLNKIKKSYAVYIDPAIWKLGNWYQYDGKMDERHGNTLAFVVNKSQSNVTANVTAKATSVKTAVKTPTPTPSPQNETETVVPLPPAKPTVSIPVVSASPTFPPPRGLPSSPFVPALAVLILIGVIILRDNRGK
jgi:hypothetical protein